MDIYSTYQSLTKIYARVTKVLPGGFALPPLSIAIELTYRCNLKCEMCYQRKQIENRNDQLSEEMQLDSIKKIIDQTPPFCVVIFSGGEPFVRKDILDILSYTSKKRFCHVVSNGTFITTDVARSLVKSNLLSLGISIDGSPEIHDSIRGVPGSFDKSIAVIKRVKEIRDSVGKKRPLINMKTTVSQKNYSQLENIYELANENGADYCTFQILNNSMYLSALRLFDGFTHYEDAPDSISGFDKNTLDTSLQALHKRQKSGHTGVRFLPDFSISEISRYYANELNLQDYTCSNPWTGANISPSGEMFPCLNYRIGNINQSTFAQLWNNKRYRNYRQTIKTNGLFRGCSGCCDLESNKALVAH